MAEPLHPSVAGPRPGGLAPGEDGAAAGARGRVGRSLAPAATVGFFLVALVGLLRHEMWRDEIEIWLLATQSSSLLDLLRNAATQPHPLLWYVLTYAAARVTADPHALQALSLLVGTTTVWVVMRRAPFSDPQKVLFCFGYFPLYEYTVISRSYGLGVMLVVVFCALYADRPRSYPRLALVVALLANTHLLAAVVATAFLVVMAGDAMAERRDPRARGWAAPASLAFAGGGILLGVGRVALGVSRMGPGHVAVSPFGVGSILNAIAPLYRAYLPIPDPWVRSFWNSSIVDLVPGSQGRWLALTLSVVLFACSVAALRRSLLLASLYAGGTLTILLLLSEKSSGYLRHYGHLPLLFVALLWLSVARGRSESESGRQPRPVGGTPPPARVGLSPAVSRGLSVVLGLHLGCGAFAWAVDVSYPFSSSLAASRFLARQDLSQTTLVGSIDYAAQPFAAYLHRSLFYPDQRRFGTFMTWGPERKVVRYRQVLRDAEGLLRRQGGRVVLVLDYDPLLRPAGTAWRFEEDLELELLAAFPCAIVDDESYWLVELRQHPATATDDGEPRFRLPRRRVGPMVEIPRTRGAARDQEAAPDRDVDRRRAAGAEAPDPEIETGIAGTGEPHAPTRWWKRELARCDPGGG